MSAACDPMALIRDAVAAERARTGSVKAAILAVARLVGMKPRRVEAVWWGEPVRLDWQEAERVRQAAARQLRREMAETEHRAAALRARLAAIGVPNAPCADPARPARILAGAAVEGRG